MTNCVRFLLNIRVRARQGFTPSETAFAIFALPFSVRSTTPATLDYADTGHQTLGRDPCCASRRNARLRAHASRAALGQNGRRGAADGAECVISGIRPQIAQTIVDLGIDFGGHADQSESGGSPPARVCLHVRKLGASS